ncbi:hypothetical protein BV20DRAFT_923551, partial [Pilatotrama ljubarskyi]
WVPSRAGVLGNEAVEHRAKCAARGEHSPLDLLPGALRKPLPRSVSAMRQHIAGSLKQDAQSAWTASPR